jgi:hypothetical protein
MRTFLCSALALGALTTAALADPLALTDTQMDAVRAGSHFIVPDPAFARNPNANTNAGTPGTAAFVEFVRSEEPEGLGRFNPPRFNNRAN